jgi:hypothetical protein
MASAACASKGGDGGAAATATEAVRTADVGTFSSLPAHAASTPSGEAQGGDARAGHGTGDRLRLRCAGCAVEAWAVGGVTVSWSFAAPTLSGEPVRGADPAAAAPTPTRTASGGVLSLQGGALAEGGATDEPEGRAPLCTGTALCAARAARSGVGEKSPAARGAGGRLLSLST